MCECIFLIGMHDTSNTINRVINLWASLVSHTHQLVAILAVLFKSSLELLYIKAFSGLVIMNCYCMIHSNDSSDVVAMICK